MEDPGEGVRLGTDDVVGAAGVVIHAVGRIEHARCLLDGDLEGERGTSVLACDGGEVDTVGSEPGVDDGDGLMVRSNEGVDFFLGQVLAVPVTPDEGNEGEDGVKELTWDDRDH